MLTTAFAVPTERREFEQLIRENIDAQTGRRLLNIEVKLVGTRVMVKGEALSYYTKQLALASVLKTVRAWGPLQVVHDIRVKVMP
jgi:hypothetical protein